MLPFADKVLIINDFEVFAWELSHFEIEQTVRVPIPGYSDEFKRILANVLVEV